MAILELISMIASPIMGLASSYVTRKHELSMYQAHTDRIVGDRAHEIMLTEMAMKGRAQETEQEIALTEIAGDYDILEAGIKAESALSKIQWGKSLLGDIANFARAIIRPGTTSYLLFCVSIFAGYVLLTEGITPENRILLIAMVDAFLMTLGFWFAHRSGDKMAASYHDGTYSRG